MTNKELMLSGELYIAEGRELAGDYKRAKKLTRLINTSEEGTSEMREGLFRELLGSAGENLNIEPPFRCDYGKNIHVGRNFYANYDCIVLDVGTVAIGDNVMFGPRVSVFTAGHPVDAAIRNMQLEFGRPITIGDNVWIGGGTIINPGVSIGEDTVIGSGSVVTKSIPANVIAAGNPCRVLRPITEADGELWRTKAARYRELYTGED